MKTLALLIMSLTLTGCANMLCYGTGTCAVREGSSYPQDLTSAQGAFTPRSVSLGSSSYQIVPNYSSGQITSVVRTSR
jgi:hypothetical protein